MFDKLDLTVNEWCKRIVEWRKAKGFETTWENFAEKCMLVVTEMSEAVEAHREVDTADALGFNHHHVAEELADATIRIFDLCGSLDIDLDEEITKKMRVNSDRPHRHGKRY